MRTQSQLHVSKGGRATDGTQGSDTGLALLLTVSANYALTTAQGHSFGLQCSAHSCHNVPFTFANFVATLLEKLELWRFHVGCTVPGKNMIVIIEELLNWFGLQENVQNGPEAKRSLGKGGGKSVAKGFN